MTKKYLEVLKVLVENNDWLTSKNIALMTGLSTRTVKQYISQINQEAPNTVFSSQKGYKGDYFSLVQYLNQQQTTIPETSQERIPYILNRLIRHQTALNFYDLAAQLCISPLTLKQDLPKIKRKLTEFDLSLKIHNDNINLIGIEKNKRKLLSQLLYEESNDHALTFVDIQKSFEDTDIKVIENILLTSFEQFHYFINDFSLINLLLHIAISIERIQKSYPSQQVPMNKQLTKIQEYSLAIHIAEQLEQTFHVKFSDNERYELTLLLNSRVTSIDYNEIDALDLKDIVGEECYALVKSLIEDINAFYFIDLSQNEFLTRFSLHIRNLLIRAKNNYYSKNPLTQSIKTTCPLLFESSVYLAKLIKAKADVTLNDDEIAFLAIHIGSAMEIQKDIANKLSCLIICPNYYELHSNFVKQIMQHFDQKLFISNVVSDESTITDLSSYDLIISTIPLSFIYSEAIIIVSPFFTNQDSINLNNKINERTKYKENILFERNLKQIICPDLFLINKQLTTKQETLDFMILKMDQTGYLNDTFKNEVDERELCSSTAFNNIAIPHSMEMRANKTGMFIIISDKPISWDNHEVNLILLLSINRNDRALFNQLFEALTMILTNPKNLNSVLEVSSFQQFIDTLVQCKFND